MDGSNEISPTAGTVELIENQTKKSKFNTLCPKLERLLRMLLAEPHGLSLIQLLPIGTTWASNQIKELRDWYGFTLPMQRHKYDPQNPAKWYGIFSLSDSDRVKALQLLGGAI